MNDNLYIKIIFFLIAVVIAFQIVISVKIFQNNRILHTMINQMEMAEPYEGN
jgi:hypothetical protein